MSFVNTILVNSFKLYQQQRYCKMLYIQKNNRNKILRCMLIFFLDNC